MAEAASPFSDAAEQGPETWSLHGLCCINLPRQTCFNLLKKLDMMRNWYSDRPLYYMQAESQGVGRMPWPGHNPERTTVRLMKVGRVFLKRAVKKRVKSCLTR